MLLNALIGAVVLCAAARAQITSKATLNATGTGSGPSPTTPVCCYFSELGVVKQIWWTEKISITVATVQTTVYQYDNTAITSYKTIKANSTLSIPKGQYTNFDGTSTIPGIPGTIIGTDTGPYPAVTTFVYGTDTTDPYGKVYQSPTPVWSLGGVSWVSFLPSVTNGAYACPTNVNAEYDRAGFMRAYPSGYFAAADGSEDNNGLNNTGRLFVGHLPSGYAEWIKEHPDPSAVGSTIDLTQCTVGYGDGIPIAHVPVTELTAEDSTTMTVTGIWGTPTAIPDTTPTPTPPPPPPAETPTPTPTTPPPPPPTSTPLPPPPPPPAETPSTPAAPPSVTPTSQAPPPPPPVETPNTPPAPPVVTPTSQAPPPAPPAETPNTPPAPPADSPSAPPAPPAATPTSPPPPPAQTNNPAPPPSQPTPENPPSPPNTTPESDDSPVPTPIIVVPGTTLIQPGTTQVQAGTTAVEAGTTRVQAGTTVVEAGTTRVQEGTTVEVPGTTVIQPGTTVQVQGTTLVQPGTTLAAAPTPVVIGTTTLTPGATLVVTTGTQPTTYVLPTNGGGIIVNGVTIKPTSTENIASIIATLGGFPTDTPDDLLQANGASKSRGVGLSVLGMGLMWGWLL